MESHSGLPFVSVIVPVYNMRKTVGRTLTSLLNQTYPKDRYEIIAVDNASDDGSDEVIKRYPVRYVLEDKVRNVHGARNRGIAESSGELVASCDADDAAAPNWLTELVKGWDDPAVGGSFGTFQPLLSGRSTLVERFAARNDMRRARSASGKYEFIGTGNTAYKRSVLERIGGFDTTLFSSGDMIFSWRVTNELGLNLRFNPDSLMYIHTRKLLMSRIRQNVRLGCGFCSGRSRYGISAKPKLTSALGLLALAGITGWGRFFYRLFKHQHEMPQTEYVIESLLYASDHMARELGRIMFIWRGDRWDRNLFW